MAHRIIISQAIKTLFTDEEVRGELTTNQLTRVDHVCTHTEISDDDFRFLLRKLAQAYCAED